MDSPEGSADAGTRASASVGPGAHTVPAVRAVPVVHAIPAMPVVPGIAQIGAAAKSLLSPSTRVVPTVRADTRSLSHPTTPIAQTGATANSLSSFGSMQVSHMGGSFNFDEDDSPPPVQRWWSKKLPAIDLNNVTPPPNIHSPQPQCPPTPPASNPMPLTDITRPHTPVSSNPVSPANLIRFPTPLPSNPVPRPILPRSSPTRSELRLIPLRGQSICWKSTVS